MTGRDKLVTSGLWAALTDVLAVRQDAQYCIPYPDRRNKFIESPNTISTHEALGTSSAIALQGYQPRGPRDPFERESLSRNNKVEEQANQLRRDRERPVTLLQDARTQYKSQDDKERMPITLHAVGRGLAVHEEPPTKVTRP